MQRERRRDPYPWTWEIPLALGLGGLLVLVVGIQVARAAANLLAGAGWTWPATNTGPFASPIGSAFWTSLPSVVTGDAAAGLAQQPPANDVASAPLLWACLIATHALLLAAGSWTGAHGYRRWGSGRIMGMATIAEAEALLGVTRLRKTASIVRPDLYGPRSTAAAPAVHRDASQDANLPLGHGLSPWFQPGRRRETGDTG